MVSRKAIKVFVEQVVRQFHPQQCAEKYLKARLVEADISFPKTHDLEVLLDLILPQEPLWEAFRPKLNDLASFAITFRYPGESATQEMAKIAVSDCQAIRPKSNKTSGFQKTYERGQLMLENAKTRSDHKRRYNINH